MQNRFPGPAITKNQSLSTCHFLIQYLLEGIRISFSKNNKIQPFVKLPLVKFKFQCVQTLLQFSLVAHVCLHMSIFSIFSIIVIIVRISIPERQLRQQSHFRHSKFVVLSINKTELIRDFNVPFVIFIDNVLTGKDCCHLVKIFHYHLFPFDKLYNSWEINLSSILKVSFSPTEASVKLRDVILTQTIIFIKLTNISVSFLIRSTNLKNNKSLN